MASTQQDYPTIASSIIKPSSGYQKSQNKSLILSKMHQKYDYMIKLIIVGDSGVGKTNIISSFCHPQDNFNQTHVPTIGVDFCSKIIQLNNKNVKIQVWDTAGQQRFRTITETYYKGAAGILLVYSVGSQQSFYNIRKWMQQIKQKTSQSVNIVLIANKSDLTFQSIATAQNPLPNSQFNQHKQQYRIVTKDQGWNLSQQYQIRYHQVSAKLGLKIDQIFYNIAESINSQIQELKEDFQDSNFKSAQTIQQRNQRRKNLSAKIGVIFHQSDDKSISLTKKTIQQKKNCSC